jgi:hypothetical protein
MNHERSTLSVDLCALAPTAPEAFVRAASDPRVGAVIDAPFEGAPLLIAFTSGDADGLGGFDVADARAALTRAEGVPVNVVVLRDVAAMEFQFGCAGLAGSAATLTLALASLVDELAPGPVVTFGEGLAGYAALQFGAELHRRFVHVRTVALGAPNALEAPLADAVADPRRRRMFEVFGRRAPEGFLAELAPQLESVAREVGPLEAHDRVEGLSVSPSGAEPEPPRAARRPGVAVERRGLALRAHGEGADGFTALVAAGPAESKPIDHGWQRWVAENLMLDVAPFELQCRLIEHGHDAADSRAVVDAIAGSAALAGADRLRARMAKRDWLLRVLRTSRSLDPRSAAVPVVPALDRATFLGEHYAAGRPVVMTGALDRWPALTRWSFDQLRARCGDALVQAQSGREGNARFEIESPLFRRTLRFAECLDAFERVEAGGGRSNDLYITAGNGSVNEQALAELWPDTRPALTEYLDAASPLANGFFWCGPRGSMTPLHHDLTNNFMAQVRGRKRVWLVAPEETPSLANHLHCYSEIDLSAVDYARFPAMRDVRVLEVVLEPGQLLFIPIGWWHQVEGLDATITMTFVNFLWRNDFVADYASYGEL